MTPAAVPLHAYQREWVLDRSRYKIGMFARQTGKTFCTTLEIVDDCYDHFSRGRRARWVILSRGERQAREAMDEGVKRHAAAYGMALEEMAYDFVGDSGEAHKALEVVLPGGSRITALPANPDTARGYSANVFLDEFSIHRASRAIWGALFPVISAGHRIRVTSTPHGKQNKFYELMTGEAAGKLWSRHVADIHRAVADGLPRDVDELRAGLDDDELWRQEYELEWLDEASAWLTYDLINACEDAGAAARIADGPDDDHGRVLELLRAGADAYTGGPAVFGNDIARRGDLWTLWALEHVGDVLWTRALLELRNRPFAVHDEVMDEAWRIFRPYRIAMDQTSMGEKPVEDAQRRYGQHVVEGVVFSVPRRLTVATAARQRFEARTIRIPAGDRVLRADLHSVKRVAGATGAPRLLVDEDARADAGGSHADRFWAGSLACAAADEAPREYAYRAARPLAGRRRGPAEEIIARDRWDAFAGAARLGRGLP